MKTVSLRAFSVWLITALVLLTASNGVIVLADNPTAGFAGGSGGGGLSGLTSANAGANITITGTPTSPIITSSGGTATPGGSTGQTQYNNAGALGGYTPSGDASVVASTGVFTVKGLNGTLLSGLATGLLKNTTSTGVPSIAVAGTDYLAVALASGKTYVGNGSGNAVAVTPSGDVSMTNAGVFSVLGLNGTLLSGLSTGLLKNTTSTGVPTIAVAGTDYLAVALANGKIYIGNGSGNAAAVTPSGDATTTNAGVFSVVGLNGTLLSGLATGLLKNTTTTGVPTIAVANTDYLPVASPTMTGTPAAPTAAAGTNTTQIATTAFVNAIFAAPPALGSTTPAAVSSSNLSATGTVTLPSLSISLNDLAQGAASSGNVLGWNGTNWAPTSAGGSGVTSIGNLTPLFNTTVSGSSATFAQQAAAALSWFGNATGSSANPSFNTSAVPVTMGGTATATAPSSGQILFAQSSTAYAPETVSGDVTAASTGAVTLATVNSNVGSFTNANITVNGKGLITAASNGSGGGGGGFTGSTKTSSFTAVAQNAYYVTSGTVTCTLPTAVSVSGQEIVVFNDAASGVTLTFNTTSSQTISGQASGAITSSVGYNGYRFMSDGSNWLLE